MDPRAMTFSNKYDQRSIGRGSQKSLERIIKF